eukprot:926310_1
MILYGWNHYCSSSKCNEYLDEQCVHKSCTKDGHFNPMDHPKTTKCGIFINFEQSSFQEFVQIKYHECFPMKVSALSSPDDVKTLSERIVFAPSENALNDRDRIFKWIHKEYVIEETQNYYQYTEQYVATMSNKLKNHHLYCYALAQLCFELHLLKIYKQRDNESENTMHMYLIQRNISIVCMMTLRIYLTVSHKSH